MKQMTRKTEHGVLAALAVVLFFTVNILAAALFSNLRVDLTEEGLFTISQGTHNILEGLEDPIEIKLYFSEKRGTPYPSFLRYGQRVRNLLKEYERPPGVLPGGLCLLKIPSAADILALWRIGIRSVLRDAHSLGQARSTDF